MPYDKYKEIVAYDLQWPAAWTAYNISTCDGLLKVAIIQKLIHSGNGILLIDPKYNLAKGIENGRNRGLSSIALLSEIRKHSLMCVL